MTARGLSLAERFWQKVAVAGPDECWLWTSNTNGRYGTFAMDGRTRTGAHRVSFLLHHGPIPDGLYVLHSCAVPRCVNPAHLRAGTQVENMADHRATRATGEGD